MLAECMIMIFYLSSQEERGKVYQAMVGVLAQIHAVDVKKVGELLRETKSFLVRLYQVGNTITEVKQQKPLGWGTNDHSRLKLML